MYPVFRYLLCVSFGTPPIPSPGEQNGDEMSYSGNCKRTLTLPEEGPAIVVPPTLGHPEVSERQNMLGATNRPWQPAAHRQESSFLLPSHPHFRHKDINPCGLQKTLTFRQYQVLVLRELTH